MTFEIINQAYLLSESRISEELVKDDLSIPGIIIVTILGLIVILIIILICHAQKQKVYNGNIPIIW